MNLATLIRPLAPLRPLVMLAAALAACGGPGESPPVGPPARTALVVGTPRAGVVQQGRVERFAVPVTQGASYVVSLTSLGDSALGLNVTNGGAGPSNTQATSPKDFTVQAAGSSIDIDVGGTSIVKPVGNFVVTVVPAPVPGVPVVGTSGAIAARTPTVGWVEARSTSRYQTTGLTGTHTVSLVGLTADAQLHVYSDETYAQELDCTLRHPEARECVVSSAGAYFSVTAGPLNRDGAGYVILVW